MKRTKTPTSESKKPELDKLAEELGPDVARHLHRAFKLTAAAFYRRAAEKAEAQLREIPGNGLESAVPQ
ncbi:MAG TPA: hypothetical protein VKU19_28000 [Bryobacteraceae bacterium]|nr:hypothetical protein [Bryobacteraceae bacterium]